MFNKWEKPTLSAFRITTIVLTVVIFILTPLTLYVWVPNQWPDAFPWSWIQYVSLIAIYLPNLILMLYVIFAKDNSLDKLLKAVYYPPRWTFNNRYGTLVNTLISPIFFAIQLAYLIIWLVVPISLLLLNWISLLAFGAVQNISNKEIGNNRPEDIGKDVEVFGYTMTIPSIAFPNWNSMLDMLLCPVYFTISLTLLILMPFALIGYPVTLLFNKK